MKSPGLLLACALAGVLLAAPTRSAFGQTEAEPSGYKYDSYYNQDANSAPAPAPAKEGTAACEATCGKAEDACGCNDCEDACDECGCGHDMFPCCKHGEPWKLFDCPCSKVKVSGWLDQSFTWNPDNPTDGFNGPVTFNDRANEYMMQQLYLSIERPTDTKCQDWDFGGRIDLLYGTDFRFTMAQGLDAQDDGSPRWGSSRFYGLAMPQAYAEVAYQDLKVKVGHFYTILGYEVVPATGNFFGSHAYTMQYGEPFTHTGALATYALNERVSLIGGVTRGWDNFEDLNDSESFLGGITVNSEDGKGSLAYAVHTGDEANAFNGLNANRFVQSVVYSRSLSEKLKYVFQSDYGVQDGTGGAPDAEWYGVNQYLFRTINDCWSWGVRGEWFRDDDGTRVVPAGDFAGSNTASVGGFAGNFYEVTAGLNWKPNANLIVRPELRHDWFNGDDLNGVQPFDDGSNDDDQFLAYFDVIVTY